MGKIVSSEKLQVQVFQGAMHRRLVLRQLSTRFKNSFPHNFLNNSLIFNLLVLLESSQYPLLKS